ncbi:MAG: prolipoprotein diacylglyceryl transferase [Candidatus Eisenbacteria bacterium]
MHRTLFDVGPFSIHLYGVMLAFAFWLGIELSIRIARKRGMDPVAIMDLGIIILVSSVIGARLLYVITHFTEYRHDLVGIFRVWEGGLTFYGGLAAGVAFGIGYLKRQGLRVLEVTDIIAPQIALGIALARVGCFLNGCCFGRESTLPWACTFPADSQAGWGAMAGKTIHPTQIYSAIANLVIFLFLRKLLGRRAAAGTVFFTFLIVYGVWRFAVDFLRYYEVNMYVMSAERGITWNQVASLVIILTGTVLLAKTRRRGDHHEIP